MSIDDYADFQASVIRGQFDRETQMIREGNLFEEDRYWENTGFGKWKNTPKANNEARDFLLKNEIIHIYETKQDSWRTVGNSLIFKRLDMSSITHKGSAIPQDYYSFFLDIELNEGKRDIKLTYHGKEYNAYLKFSPHGNGRILRVFWRTDFKKFLEIQLGDQIDRILEDSYNSLIELRFQRINFSNYEISLLSDQEFKSDSKEFNKPNEEFGEIEGRRVLVHSYRYERNPKNRKKAIEYHGTKCYVCGFDFFEHYGKLGEGFIEVHHRRPLYLKGDKPQKIDPIKDLAPVCSNCHRMLHRKVPPYEIEELKKAMRNKT